MATASALKLSGSTNGLMVKVAQTATAGTLIHTAHATDLDFIRLYAVNSSAADVKLTIEWGGATSPDCLIEVTIPAESGLVEVIPEGLLLTGSVTLRAFAGSADVIMLVGSVTRYTA